MSSLFSLGGNLFGGSGSRSTSQSLSENQAYPYLSGALAPQIGNATGSSNMMASLLGLNGGPAQTEGFNNWRDSTGYQFGLDQGTRAITGSAAARGLLNSGSTARALSQFGQDYGNQQFGNYMQQLMGLGNMGNNAAGILTNAGQRSTSSSNSRSQSSGGGLGAAIGSFIGK